MRPTAARETCLALLMVLLIMVVGCAELADPLKRSGGEASSSNCVGCHTDEATLRAVADPDTSEGDEPGEG